LTLILQVVEAGEVTLVISSVLEFENSRNPFSLRREWVERCLQQATAYQRADEAIRRRAEKLEKHGLKAIDALHVACAEAADAEYFLTCDDRLLRKHRLITVKSMNPLDFVQRVMGERP